MVIAEKRKYQALSWTWTWIASAKIVQQIQFYSITNSFVYQRQYTLTLDVLGCVGDICATLLRGVANNWFVIGLAAAVSDETTCACRWDCFFYISVLMWGSHIFCQKHKNGWWCQKCWRHTRRNTHKPLLLLLHSQIAELHRPHGDRGLEAMFSSPRLHAINKTFVTFICQGHLRWAVE